MFEATKAGAGATVAGLTGRAVSVATPARGSSLLPVGDSRGPGPLWAPIDTRRIAARVAVRRMTDPRRAMARSRSSTVPPPHDPREAPPPVRPMVPRAATRTDVLDRGGTNGVEAGPETRGP